MLSPTATLVVLSFVCMVSLCHADIAKFTVSVIDDITGEPMKDVEVTAGFGVDAGWKAWTESAPIVEDVRHTDQSGLCRLKGETNTGETWATVRHPPSGYYSGHCYDSRLAFKEKSIFGVWQPDDLVVTIRLQRVEHPIPLKARYAKLTRWSGIESFDGTNCVLRYDLMAGDWLPPEGTGTMADVVIRTHLELGETVKITKSQCAQLYDYTSTIEFPGEGNGFIEKECPKGISGIKIRSAPEIGYLPKKDIHYGRKRVMRGQSESAEDYSECNDATCYCFRIRSKFDENGNLVDAYYGKIYGGFDFFAGTTKFVSAKFLYYLNPKSLDRNLEWDRKTNLFDAPEKKRRRSAEGEIFLP